MTTTEHDLLKAPLDDAVATPSHHIAPNPDLLPHQSALELVVPDVDGIRLDEFQMLNWGTFDRTVQRLRLFSGNALLTGQIGAGKSTIVDGLTALFADTSRVTFNLAAGAVRRERSVATYVLGTYGHTRDEDTGTNKAETLRHVKGAYSVLLARFTGVTAGARPRAGKAGLAAGLADADGNLTVGVVFWFPESGTNPNKLYFVSPGHLDINEDLVGHRDHRAVRAALRDANAELFENNFRGYQRHLCRQLGLSSTAVDLLVQTISMKQVGNLTGFVRKHMLDETDVAARIDEILGHYADLLRSHELVQEARKQLEKLDLLRKDALAYDRAQARIDSSNDANAAVSYRGEHLRAELLEAALADVRATLPGLKANRDLLQEQVNQARTRHTQNEVAIATHGGAVLREAQQELDTANTHLKSVGEAAAELGRYAAALHLAPFEGAGDYPRFTRDVAQAAETLAAGDQAVRDTVFETEKAFREARDELNRTRNELAAASTADSNVPPDEITMRRRVCDALGLTTTDLPYVAELLTVPRDAEAWEAAAERLLRPFALSLLVPHNLYDQVSTWVDANDMRGRLTYYPVPAAIPVPAPVAARSIAACVEVRPDTFATAWLHSEVARRFDHVRVEHARNLRDHRRAVTLAGQIKDGTRHVKDDRKNLLDRRNYVLGWDTAARREALNLAIPGLEADVDAEKKTADEARIAQSAHGERKNSVRQIRERFSDLTTVDVATAADRVREAEDMVASFESDQDLARYLARQTRLEGQVQKFGRDLSAAERALGGAEDTESKQARQLVETRDRLEELQEPELDGSASETLTEAIAAVGQPTSLEKIDLWQRQVSEELASRADSARATKDRAGQKLVGHMKDVAQEWPDVVGELITTDPDSRHEFLAVRERLERDDLPRYELNFRHELETNAIHHLARFSVALDQEARKIATRIGVINNALNGIDYRPRTYIMLEADPTTDPVIREFRRQLEAITGDTMFGDEDTYAEIRFLRVKELLDRFAGREGFTNSDETWTAKVTDVRNWFAFSGSERSRLDDTEVEHYEDSGGKSGGQKEKLAYTVLAASLSYQYGLAGGRTEAFRFVMIDEAFGRGSDESTRFGLELFGRLGLQLLTVTPLQKVHTIENYVDGLAYVRKIEPRSQLLSMPIEEYRAKRAQHAAQASGIGPL